MISQALIGAYQHPLRVVDSADFDGVNDRAARGAELTGNADGKTGILSFWIRFDGTFNKYIATNNVGSLTVYWSNVTGTIQILGQNGAAATILETFTTSTFASGATWYHILCSWDLAATTVKLYVNDVSDQQGSPTATDDTINYTTTDHYLGGSLTSNTASACVAEYYYAPNQYLDIALVANRRRFISASGKPVHLGATGSLPTGVAPLVYCHLDDAEAVANYATNRGTGGNFTITGTLDTGSTSPSD